MQTKRNFSLISIFFFIFNVQADTLKLSVVTEHAHSLQYESKLSGKIEGPAAELVEKVIHTAGIDFSTQVLPWARAYKIAEQNKNTLIYSIVRTADRESKFHWLGIISKPQYYLFSLKSNHFRKSVNVNSFKNYRVATILDSASYLALQSEGFKYLVPLTQAEQVFAMLKRKRVDFITANKRTFLNICRAYSEECENIIPIAPIKMSNNNFLYFAMNKESDPELVNALKMTYQKLLSTQEIKIF